LSAKLEITEKDLGNALDFFEKNEFSDSQDYVAQGVFDHILHYKMQLLKGVVSSKEDKLIRQVLL